MSDAPAPLPPARTFNAGFGVLLAVANLGAFAIAFQDKSWGALWVAIIGGPITNAVLLVGGILAAVFLKRRQKQASLVLIFVGPIVAALGLLGAILLLDLHGC